MRKREGGGEHNHDVIIEYCNYFICSIPHNIVLHHKNDTAMINVEYYMSIESALRGLYQKILLRKLVESREAANLKRLRDAIESINKAFSKLLKGETEVY